MSHENQVLHIGRTVAQWRAIVTALRIAAADENFAFVRHGYEAMAASLESQLPALPPGSSSGESR